MKCLVKWIIDGRGQLQCRHAIDLPIRHLHRASCIRAGVMVTLLAGLPPIGWPLKIFLHFVASAAAMRRSMNIKRICITCAGLLLMFINNEYTYCTRNSVQIIEDSDNWSSNKHARIYTVQWTEWESNPGVYCVNSHPWNIHRWMSPDIHMYRVGN